MRERKRSHHHLDGPLLSPASLGDAITRSGDRVQAFTFQVAADGSLTSQKAYERNASSNLRPS